MKRTISILALSWLMSLQYVAFASSPCSTGFALSYAVAGRDFVAGMEACKDAALPDLCREEILRRYNSSINTAYNNFNTCCCVNSYACCN